ncbi:hypothetical protein [Hyphomonas pacifica]|uniref:Uncharacterized protein n=1 Tax=Hyphomonas pacifica TaxID=1280941 RepID=A0A8B2PFS4_9PROT|nr:hypothetical protein [Hyphomonas pacifica]RAN30665.1 hypothetical protein HY3_05810 [Hyphomonas pacifica]
MSPLCDHCDLLRTPARIVMLDGKAYECPTGAEPLVDAAKRATLQRNAALAVFGASLILFPVFIALVTG